MNASNNRRNHDFQIVYFLLGSCHTADGAYALLCDLREEREMALANADAARLRCEAQGLRAQDAQRGSRPDRLEAQAVLLEIERNKAVNDRCYAAAEAELAFIERCIAAVQPHRRYSSLPDAQAHEAAQREEWALELAARAENFLLTSGTIPADQLATMRMHPDFAARILPVIEGLKDETKRNAALRQPMALPGILKGLLTDQRGERNEEADSGGSSGTGGAGDGAGAG